MARGESPFQGRYTAPQADLSGMTNVDFGAGFKAIGQAVEKYKLNKEERLTAEASIEGILAENSELAHPDMGPLFQKQMDGKATLSETRQINSFLKSSTAEQERMRNVRMAQLAEEFAGNQRDEVERKELFREGQIEDLDALLKDKATWLGKHDRTLTDSTGKVTHQKGTPIHPEMTEEKWVKNLTQSQRRMIGNEKMIRFGPLSPKSELEELREDFSVADILGKFNLLPGAQDIRKKTLGREAEKLDKGPTVEEEIEQERQTRDLEGRIQESRATGLEHSTSEEMLEFTTERIRATIQEAGARIKHYESAKMMASLNALKAADPSLYEQLEDNRKRTNAVFNDKASWKDADGNTHWGDISKYGDELKKAVAAGKSITPSQKMVDNQHVLDELERQSTQFTGATYVPVDTTSGAGELPFGMPSFEEWKGGFLGFGEGSYKEYVEKMKSKGFQPFQIPAEWGGVTPARRQGVH